MNQTILGLIELAKFLKTLKPEFNNYIKADLKANSLMNQVKGLNRLHPSYKAKATEAFEIRQPLKNRIIQLIHNKIHELGLYDQEITFWNVHEFSSLYTEAVFNFISELQEETVKELESAYADYLEFKKFSIDILEQFEILYRLDQDVYKDLFKPLEGSMFIKEKPTSEYTAKEIALAYLFDLEACGQKIPINPKTGQTSKKEIQSAAKNYNIKPDAFYKAVQNIKNTYSIYSPTDLNHVSPRWQEAVLNCSTDLLRVKEFLKGKGLI